MIDATARHPVQLDRHHGTESFPVLDPTECLELLSTTTVGRVAFAGAGGLVLLPVNYRVVDGDVHIRTSATGALAELATHDGEVLFEIDYHATTSREGWSVLVRGTAASVTDSGLSTSAELAPLVPWAPSSSALLLRLRTRHVTGRRVFVAPWAVPGTRRESRDHGPAGGRLSPRQQ